MSTNKNEIDLSDLLIELENLKKHLKTFVDYNNELINKNQLELVLPKG